MSGGGKGGSKDKGNPGTPQEVMPAMRTFGAGMNPAVTAQLKAAGLLGVMPQQASFGPVTVPILSRPDEVDAYLKSIGKTPTALGSTSTGSKSEKPFIKHGSI